MGLIEFGCPLLAEVFHWAYQARRASERRTLGLSEPATENSEMS